MGAAAAIATGGALLGGYMQKRAGDKAADAATHAADVNAEVQREMYGTTRRDLSPWMRRGKQANTTMMDLLGYNGPEAKARAVSMFQTSPGYEFAVNEGVKGLDRSAIRKGNLNSGRQMMAISDYTRGMADQEFGNYYNRFADISNRGQNAAAQVGSAGTNAAAGTGKGYMDAADMVGDAYAMSGKGYATMYGAPAQAASLYAYYNPRKGTA